MTGPVIYVSKVIRLPLLDANGEAIGRIDDVLLAPAHDREPPSVTGFVATVQRRRIFVNAGRVGDVGVVGVRLHSGTIDLRQFQLRHGELLAAGGLFEQRVDGEVVTDLGLCRAADRLRSWEVATVVLRPPGGLRRRRATRVVPWDEVRRLFEAGPVAIEMAELREMHPSDVAQRVRNLPLHRR